MRRGLASLALVALTLSACGDESLDNKASKATHKVKASSGPAPAVVLLPDTGDKASATAEAKKLSRLGIAAHVVEGPASAPKDPKAFERAVSVVQRAVADLKKRDGIDPHRIGLIGEGVGAHVAAVVAGRDPGLISAAALADIGGTVVPSPAYAPYKWLGKAAGIRILFQRDLGARAMTEEELAKLIDVAPPGTLMEQYSDLGTAAERARDRWIQDLLVSG
jgi:dienelactone hydrolase